MPDQPWDTGVRANQCTWWTTSSPGNCFLPSTISSARICFLPPEFSNLSPPFPPFSFHIARLVQSGKCFDISSSRINKSQQSLCQLHIQAAVDIYISSTIFYIYLLLINCWYFALPSSLPTKIVWQNIKRQADNKCCYMSPIKLHLINRFLSTKCCQNRIEFCSIL